MIKAYFTQIKTIIDQYATTSFILEAKMSFETRPGNQVYIADTVIFVNDSKLYFSEYLDQTGDVMDKFMYTYQYQNVDNQLIFRYDNARHKPALSSRAHKHLPEQTIKAPAPTLDEVLAEIATTSGWV